MKFRQFTKPNFLRSVGRRLLEQFFDRFADELAARNAVLPPHSVDDHFYYSALAFLLMSPEALPDSLMEAMFAIEEMATAEGQERLEKAVEAAGLAVRFGPEASHGDVAMQVWLEAPALVASLHNQQRMARLCSFHYIGAMVRAEVPFAFPEPLALENLTTSLDGWFATHNRGHQTTQIEVHRVEAEWWFLVRHGDTFARKARVEKRRMELLHYRPAKDDVVVYCAERDEIRINARTKGERELYRAQFSRFLRGQENYFSQHRTLTLQPLRTEGRDALDARGVEGIRGIVLREIEVALEKQSGETIRYRSRDFFGMCGGCREVISERTQLLRAVFEIQFADAKKPRAVEVRPANVVKMGRQSDARLVNQWLSARGFRAACGAQSRNE